MRYLLLSCCVFAALLGACAPPADTRGGATRPPSVAPAAVANSPTLLVPAGAPPRPSPTAAVAPSPDATPVPDAAAFVYRWPAEIPAGLTLIPAESRVAADGEEGVGGIGFYLLTFGDARRRLVVGGGAVDTLPVSGKIATLEIDGHRARLVDAEDGGRGERELVIDGYAGRLFLYGVGIEREELVRAAESLAPVDVAVLRRRLAAP